MAPLHLPVKYVYLLVLTWPLLLGSPIQRTRDDQTLPRGTKHDHAIASRDIYTPASSTDNQERDKVVKNRAHLVTVPQHNCTSDRDCYPREKENCTIPPDLVQCLDNTCNCSDCFYSLNDTCAVKHCHRYSNGTGKCVDERKSQKTVLLLSVFLSSVGAANTYIGQDTLGAVQISIIILAMLLCMCIVCTKKCYMACCETYLECVETDDICDCCEECSSNCHDCFAPICILLTSLVIVLFCIVIIAWWAADIVAFTENTRLDGDGCPLKYDL